MLSLDLLDHYTPTHSDPATREAYDRVRRGLVSAAAEGFTGRPYSQWAGAPGERRALFVDEGDCVGCLGCALAAPATFAIETATGRARVRVGSRGGKRQKEKST